jgi:urease accessory protein
MLVINQILGNINTDEKWKELYQVMRSENHVQTIMFTRKESERSRLYKKLPGFDEEIGINIKRGTVLHDGDVLYYKEGENMFVVDIEAEEMMVLHFVEKFHEDKMLELAVKLGHAIGNQHWQMKVVGGKIYVPIMIDKKVMESVMKTHNIPGVKYYFEEEVGGQILSGEYGHLQNTSHNYHHHQHKH